MAGEQVEIGPFGGETGEPWDYSQEVLKFQVASLEGVIVSITFNGYFKAGGKGPNQGNPGPEVSLQPGEYLRSIKGATGRHQNIPNVLQTISFVTNKNTYGPYGTAADGAVLFDAQVINGKITGFRGRDGWWVDAIVIKLLPEED